ncbi:MAG: HlyC/CorC family transporter [Lachnospiraceae bacterium]|nr:HlyC/CorC family transporter [Lachnospiraceae bacterium]
MDDGGSPVIGLIVFLVLVVINGALYGFMTALEEVTESQVQKRAQEGNKHAPWLLEVMDGPYRTRHAIQVMVTFVSGIFGVYQIHLLGNLLANSFPGHGAGIRAACFVAAMVAGVFFFAVVGIIAPQKIAARRPEKWLFALAGVVHGMVSALIFYTYPAEKLSNLVVRLAGLDPNASFDDVTEEEIISMVKEGHQQGVLQASEAEMIHNIFAFDDKEAKDIMTHRKHVAAVEGKTQLKDVLEFILEGNNSRFPVYKDDIDNIIGIIHMKDVMIESRKGGRLDWAVQDIPGLVREAFFIPETRNINELFKGMQSKKSHMVIVVDEYGQTAGIVAMEDILEEIVGNIFDEYDKEETMIASQQDGSFLMKGMAPFDEVCQTLGITLEDEEYDTLNGFLISLIGRIPGEHEQFDLECQGWRFHVFSVRDKMVHMVRALKLQGSQEG